MVPEPLAGSKVMVVVVVVEVVPEYMLGDKGGPHKS